MTDSDLDVVRLLLPHQLRVLGREVDAVIVTVNRTPPTASNFGPLDEILADAADAHPSFRVREVDHSEAAGRWVSETFFGGASYPALDFKGTPFHIFFELFRHVDTDYLLHIDSDMLLGGDWSGWIPAAIDELRSDASLVAINPLAGPPHPDGFYEAGGRAVDRASGPGYLVPTLSTRIYLSSLATMTETLPPLPLRLPHHFWGKIRPRVLGTGPVDLPERLMSDRMADLGLARLDIGGPGKAWSLHPDYKTPQFVAQLPQLVERVEAMDLPRDQLGRFDVHPSAAPVDDRPTRWDRAVSAAGKAATNLLRNSSPR
jgi:hypothetical protein